MAGLGEIGEIVQLTSQTVNSTETTIAHGWGAIPDMVFFKVRNAAAHYVNQTATATTTTNIYLIADTTLTTCVDIYAIFFKGLART